MKKIILVLIVLLMCGCEEQKQNIDVGENDTPVITTKEEYLEKSMREQYKEDKYAPTKENVDLTYFTPLKSLPDYSSYKHLFEGCDAMTTGFSVAYLENEEDIVARYRIYIDCDGVTKIYYYVDLDENTEPTVTERANTTN